MEILKRIQADVSDVKVRLTSVEERLTSVEKIVRRSRRDYAGMLVMMHATAGEFDERVSELESRMDRSDR